MRNIGMDMYSLDVMDDEDPTVDYSSQVEVDNGIEPFGEGKQELYLARFEQEFAAAIADCEADDIGGLVVYCDAGGEVRAVYDYERFLGWIV